MSGQRRQKGLGWEAGQDELQEQVARIGRITNCSFPFGLNSRRQYSHLGKWEIESTWGKSNTHP